MKVLTLACAAMLVGAFATPSPAATPAVADLDKALALANKDGKLLFVQCGRPALPAATARCCANTSRRAM